MTDKELNKKLAEWAGFRPATQQEYSLGSTPDPSMDRRGWGYLYPNGRIEWYLPNFTQSLDACFKWLVQKVDTYTLHYDKGRKQHLAFAELNGRASGSFFDEEPALALCEAIEKLIDEEAKDEQS